MVAGIVLGSTMPQLAQFVGRLEIAHVNLPVGILIWIMIIPMLMKIDFSRIGDVWQQRAGIGVTLFVNWAVKPFTMAALGWLFIGYLFAPWLPADQIDSYIAGLILLGAAPCTAMVFVWSNLCKGDANFTISQVALNDLIMVFAFSAMINRMSVAAAQLAFYAYAALMGLSLSFIFAVYTGTSIATTFLVTSIAFAGLSLYGYTTKRDLSGMGTFLMMGLIGLVVASIVNLFLASDALSFAISVIGVLIFAGLTAYDTQSIKTEYVEHAAHGDQEWLGKAAIMGALRLYLDFINMFMFLLQFLGNRE
jgi:FtsH-binding integral membrane protein